jgi:hypothetical protein
MPLAFFNAMGGRGHALSIETASVLKSGNIACRKCGPSFKFYRSDRPHIDGSGFESYKLTCRVCGLMFVGIVDPRDGMLLLTALSQVALV